MIDGAAAGRVYDLAHPLDPAMPVSPNHPGYRMALLRRHGDMVRADGSSASNELLVMGGHTGTHLDALAHVSYRGKLFGGVDAVEAQTGGRFSRLGVESVAPMVCRGVLLDVAGHRGVDTLPAGEAISARELDAVASAEGVRPPEHGAVLVRSGWARLWSDPSRYLGHASGVPGPDESGARWIAEARPLVTGHDSMAYEHLGRGAGHALLPAHRMLLVERGVHIIENLDLEALARDRVYEFLFVCLPLKFVGATGSPVRPIAVVE
ncbi:MAG: cyclase family protein [Chloroflexota bacterium]|nr:cyclase family protein [Chloroflexota bacterium]